MAIRLTDIDLDDLIEQAQQQGELIYQPMAFGTQFNFPKHLGEGGARALDLRNGLFIEIRKSMLKQPIQHILQHGSNFPLTAKFYLSGSSRVQTLDASDIDPDYQEVAGHHYLYHLPDQTEIEEWQSDEQIYVVMVSADPNYCSGFNPCEAVPSKPLQKLLAGDRTQRFHQPLGQITPLIRQLLQQMLHCPYTGLM